MHFQTPFCKEIIKLSDNIFFVRRKVQICTFSPFKVSTLKSGYVKPSHPTFTTTRISSKLKFKS